MKEDMSKADKILDEAKGKFSSVVVVGIKSDNEVDIVTTNPQYPILHWMLNKALFTINIHEMHNSKTDNPEEKVLENV